MSVKIKFYTLLCIAQLMCSIAISQTPTMNLEKYWKYKERSKNFVVPGDCQGCSLPVEARGNNPGGFMWSDQTLKQGYYIAYLAMEYKLRVDHGQSTTEIDRELYYAIESLNRLDKYAEKYWDEAWNGVSNSTAGVLNGFLIRDDVSKDFFDQTYNGDLIENHLNKSYFPPPLNFRAMGPSSGYLTGLSTAPCGGHELGPEEMSQDHIIHILHGLGMVVKLVPVNATYNNTAFMDGATGYVQEAKNIAERIILYAQSTSWIYINPITLHPAQGVTWNDCNPNNPVNGGAWMEALAYGYAMALSNIMGDFNPANSTLYFTSHFASDPFMVSSSSLFSIWQNSLPPSPNEDFKVLMLAAIGNLWGNQTQATLGNRSDVEYENGDEMHVPQAVLANSILFGNAPAMPNSVWECLLNSAPCGDFRDDPPNFEWGFAQGKLMYGPNTRQEYWKNYLSGIPYLYFFNLYNIYNPSYLGSNYLVIPATKVLNGDYMIGTEREAWDPYLEHDVKNYYAGGQITAANYHILNDNDPDQTYAPALATAKIKFRARNYIQLNPGFQVNNGSFFNAAIDQNLSSISCGSQSNSAACTNCRTGVGEENPGTASSQYGNEGIIMEPIGNDQYLLAYKNHLFKVEMTYAQGVNMLGLGSIDDCATFECRQGCGGDAPSYHVLGFQNFDPNTYISDIVYDGSNTFISFSNLNTVGSIILKATGTGSNGASFLGITDAGNGIISQNTGTSYAGQQNFDLYVRRMDYFDNHLIVSFEENMIKIGPTVLSTCSGSNMFDVTYPNGGFNWGNYSANYCGDQSFDGDITEVAYIGGYLFVATERQLGNNGRLLKVNGLGGTGNNMFAVIEHSWLSGTEYESVPNYNYYAGDQGFDSYITKITSVNGFLLVGFRDSRMVKLYGTGGTGHNCFNIVESQDGFDVRYTQFTSYLAGSMYLSNQTNNFFDWISGFTNSMYLEDALYVPQTGGPGYTIMCFHNGKVLRVEGTGGTGPGYNMFNVQPSAYGFSTYQNQYYQWMQGCADFHMSALSFQKFGDNFYLVLHPGVPIKLSGVGTGGNMFALAYQNENSFKSVCGYFYFEGSDDFTDLCDNSGNRIAQNSPLTEEKTTPSFDFSVSPNPNDGMFSLQFSGLPDEGATLEIYNSIGQKVYTSRLTGRENIRNIDIKQFGAGLYVLRVRTSSSGILSKKVLVN